MLLPTMNAEWHDAHKMPVRPTDAQRVAWHLEHVKHCGCRPIPARVIEMMGRRDGTLAPAPVEPAGA
jgi:hypothetical protein